MKTLILILITTTLISCKNLHKKPKPCNRAKIHVSTGSNYNIECLDRIKINSIEV